MMKYQMLTKIIVLTIGLTTLVSCGSTQNQQNGQSGQQGKQGQRGGGMLSTTQLIAEMDSNKDGKLSKNEVKGPLANDFSKIDSNDDGYISEEELENAPKPERGSGQRGGRQRQ